MSMSESGAMSADETAEAGVFCGLEGTLAAAAALKIE